MREDDPGGFKEDEEILETASMGTAIETIQLGEGISPTRILIQITRQDGSTKNATSSIELVNLCEYDVSDDKYDAEKQELVYSDIGRDLQMRVDALTNLTQFDKHPSEPEGESDVELLKRYHSKGDE